MVKVKFLENVFHRGEIQHARGSMAEVDPNDAARYARRGWCTPLKEDPAAKSKDAPEKKGKAD